MHWLWLLSAICCEVAGTISLKFSNGFTKIGPSVLAFVFYAVCFYSLSLALKRLEVSVAYAIWAALGIALIAVISILFLGESLCLIKMISFALIIAGVVGLSLLCSTH